MEDYEEQHPIPQHISSYQFRLVGDMTLKQFAQVAGGALIALLLYSSGFNAYIKWPLAILSFLFGVALAFFPFQDRPLEKWIVLFFKAVYNPTIFRWRKTDTKTLFFQAEEVMVDGVKLPEPATPQDPSLDKEEKKILGRITMMFSSLNPKHKSTPSAETQVGMTPSPTGPVVEKVVLEKQIPQPHVVDVKPTPIQKVPIAQVTVDPTTPTAPINPAYGQAGTITDTSAQFSPDAAPPIPPTRPNIVVGQVVGPEKEIVEGAILEIKDYNNRPIRALKSNKLGHFMIVTPLLDGKYELVTEKPGYEFEAVSFEARNELIPPIAVAAKSFTQIEEIEDEYH